jgi:hypothetical protein
LGVERALPGGNGKDRSWLADTKAGNPAQQGTG